MLDWENCIQECSQNSPKPPQIFHFSSEPDRPVWKLQSTLRSKLGQPREEDSVAQITPVSHSSSYRAANLLLLGLFQNAGFSQQQLSLGLSTRQQQSHRTLDCPEFGSTYTHRPKWNNVKGPSFFLFPSLSLNKNQIYLLLLQNTE